MDLENERSRAKRAINHRLSSFLYQPNIRGDDLKVWTALKDLDQAVATRADVTEIVGEDQWAWRSYCGECGEASEDPHVYLGDMCEGGSFCKPCLLKALALMENQDGP